MSEYAYDQTSGYYDDLNYYDEQSLMMAQNAAPAAAGAGGLVAMAANPLVGLGLMGLGIGMDLWQQGEAKKEAKKAEKRARRENAYYNLVRAAAGDAVAAPPTFGPRPTPQYGRALMDLAGAGQQAAAQQQTRQDADWLRQYREDLATERARHNQAMEQIRLETAQKASKDPTGLTEWQKLEIQTRKAKPSQEEVIANTIQNIQRAQKGEPPVSLPEGEYYFPEQLRRQITPYQAPALQMNNNDRLGIR